MADELTILACGDRAALLQVGDCIDPGVNARVHRLARALVDRRHPGIVEVVPGYSAVLVEYEPLDLAWTALVKLATAAAAAAAAAGPAAATDAAATDAAAAGTGRVVEVPVVYGGRYGPDLPALADRCGLSRRAVIRRHADREYQVYCLGFTPGFPYLGGVDPAIAAPRLDSPRPAVPAGSVGIAGTQTGIYPAESPGGWQLIGRTPLRLFDAGREPPSLLLPGDRVRFVPITAGAFRQLARGQAPRPAAAPPVPAGAPGLRILRPGMLDTIQDLGRWGYQALGVPVSGAVDPRSLMIGNWLVGNRAGAAGLEISLAGPEVEFTGAAAFALAGAFAATLYPAGGGSPRPVSPWTALLAGPGDRLRIGTATAGCRGYLCVAGGIEVSRVLGSRSTDLLGRIGPFGGRPLAAGDWLPTGQSLLPPADLAGRSLPADAVPSFPETAVLRAVPGPQDSAFTAAGLAALFGGTYRVGSRSDRQGMRLEGPAVTHRDAADIISEGMPLGGLQVPAGGQPILMLAGRQTMGGYAKAAVVVSGDVARAGQLRPGAPVRFQPVSVAEAHAISLAERRNLAAIQRLLGREPVAGAVARGVSDPAEAPAPSIGQGPTAPAVGSVAPGVPVGQAAPGQATPGQARHFIVRIAGREIAVTIAESSGDYPPE